MKIAAPAEAETSGAGRAPNTDLRQPGCVRQPLLEANPPSQACPSNVERSSVCLASSDDEAAGKALNNDYRCGLLTFLFRSCGPSAQPVVATRSGWRLLR